MAESESVSEVDTKSARIYLDNGMLVVEVKDHAIIDLDQAKAHSAALERLSDRPRPLLVVLGKMKKQTKEARDFFSKDPGHTRKYSACAMLVNNPLAKVFANFYLGINRLPRPTRMFTSREHAMEWLREFA